MESTILLSTMRCQPGFSRDGFWTAGVNDAPMTMRQDWLDNRDA